LIVTDPFATLSFLPILPVPIEEFSSGFSVPQWPAQSAEER